MQSEEKIIQYPAIKKPQKEQRTRLKRATSQTQLRIASTKARLQQKIKQNKNNLPKAPYEVDDIGPKITCHKCNNRFYYFQMEDHRNLCWKKDRQRLKQQKLKEQNHEQKGKDIKNQIKVETIKQKPQQKEQNQGQKQQILSKLQSFNIEKQRVSKIIQVRKSKIYQKQVVPKPPNDLIDQKIPCPFCGIELKLQNLDHVDSCQMSIECRHCKDKFPTFLKGSHQLVCPERLRNLKKPGTIKTINNVKSQKNLTGKYLNPQRKVQLNLKWDQIKNEMKPMKQPSREQEMTNLKQLQKQQQIIPFENTLRKYEIKPAKKKQRIQEIKHKHKQQPFLPFAEYKPTKLMTQRHHNYLPQRYNQYTQYNERDKQAEWINPADFDLQSRIRAQKLKGLPKQKLRKLKNMHYTQSNFENQTQCSICAMNFEENELVTQLKCPHIFHGDCLAPWFQSHTTCPVCKNQVTI